MGNCFSKLEALVARHLLRVIPSIQRVELVKGITAISPHAFEGCMPEESLNCADSRHYSEHGDLQTTISSLRTSVEEARATHSSNLLRDALFLADSLGVHYGGSTNICDVNERIQLYLEVLQVINKTPGPPMPYLIRLASNCSIHNGSDVRLSAEFRWLTVIPDSKGWLEVKHYTTLRLCQAFEDHSLHSFSEENITEWTTLARNLVRDLYDDHPLLSTALRLLGAALRTQFQGMKSDIDILHDAVLASRQAIAICHAQGHACDFCLNQLGWCLFRLYISTGQQNERLEGLSLLKNALEQRVPGHSKRHQTLYQIALLYQQDIKPNDEQLKLGIMLSKEALRYVHDSHCETPIILYAYSACLNSLYLITGDITQLHEAIDICGKGLQLCSDDNPERPKLLSGLALHIIRRYEASGSMSDIDEAAALLKNGLNSCRENHPLYALFSGMLGWTLSLRFSILGDPNDLDQCIALHRRFLQNCPPGHSDRGQGLNNLAGALNTYFFYSGIMEFLEQSVLLYRESCDLLRSKRSFDALLTTLENLGAALTDQYEATGDIAVLNEAMRVLEEALTNKHSLFSGRGDILQHLGTALRWRHDATESQDDLERAISYLQAALQLRPAPHPLRVESLNDLSAALASRALINRSFEDLSVSMAFQQEALSFLSPTHPKFCEVASHMALLHMFAANLYQLPRHIDTAIGILLDSISNQFNHPQHKLMQALKALRVIEAPQKGPSINHGQSRQLVTVYRMTIALLPQVALVGLNIRTRLQVLSQANALAPDAATRAIISGSPETAVEMLEEGRAVFWAQHLRLRTSSTNLPADLAARFTAIAEQLRHITIAGQDIADEDDQDVDHQKLERQASQMRSLSEEFDSLVTQVRCTPGSEHFMMTPSFSTLKAVCEQHPIVLLISSGDRCHAVLLAPQFHEPHVIKLSISAEELKSFEEQVLDANTTLRKVTKKQAVSSAIVSTKLDQTASHVLEQLWLQVMAPIVAAMGWQREEGRRRPRLWLCPTGPFSNLPVHAAGMYADNRRDYCSQYLVSSYTPTLTALLSARKHLQVLWRSETKVLLAAVAQPFRYEPLECVAQEVTEIARIVTHNSLVRTTPLEDLSVSFTTNTTTHQVMEHIADASILHMACHGVLDVNDPLGSGFAMSDDLLTVAKLMSLDLPNAFLAFLSACETAKGDATQPDQAIHLSATMLYAGFKSIIGTMWSMNDYDGPFIAKAIYSALFTETLETLDPDLVPYALDAAVGALRQQTLHPSRWALYVHIGV